jgi:hypothetical protein
VGYYLNGSNWEWTPTSFSLLRSSAVYMIDAWTGHMYVPWTVFYYTTRTSTGTRYWERSTRRSCSPIDPQPADFDDDAVPRHGGTTSDITVQAEGYNGSCGQQLPSRSAPACFRRGAALAVTRDVAPPVRVQSPGESREVSKAFRFPLGNPE